MAGLTPGAQKWHLPPCCSCANGQCLSTKANSTTGPLEHSHTAPGSAGQLVLSSTAPAPLLLLICCHAPVQSQSNPNLEQSEQHPPLSVPMPGLEAPRQTPILHIQRRDPPSVRAGGSLSNVRRRNSLGPVTPVWRGQTPHRAWDPWDTHAATCRDWLPPRAVLKMLLCLPHILPGGVQL